MSGLHDSTQFQSTPEPTRTRDLTPWQILAMAPVMVLLAAVIVFGLLGAMFLIDVAIHGWPA